ncbi:MAG: class I SAM-dependent methyltransferase [Candidatus Baldrarchaeia archaeon]
MIKTFGSFEEEIKREFLAFSEIKEGQVVLDVDIGSGFAAALLAKAVGTNGCVYSIDPSENALDKAFSRLKEEKLDKIVVLKKARVEELPFKDNFFDRVSSIMSFHHFSDPVRSLKEMYRVLKPGGILVIADWTRETTVAPHPKEQLYTPDLLFEFIKKALRIKPILRNFGEWMIVKIKK